MRSLRLFLKGLCMGSADIIPGISGGTVALILGIYEELILSIKSIDLRIIPYSLFALFKRDYRDKVKKMFLSIRFDFLIPLVIGISVAFLLLAGLIDELLKHHRSLIYSFFLGLILSSAFILYLKNGKPKPVYLMHVFSGMVLAYIFLSFTTIYLDHSLPVIFASGIVSICAMILPGISGAFIMVLLGQYEYMLSSLKSMYLPPLITYIIGAFIGVVAFSHFLSKLLKKYRKGVLSFLVGLMIGGLRIPLNEIETVDTYTILCFLTGLALVISVEIYSSRG